MKKYVVLGLFTLCGIINTARRNSIHDLYDSGNESSRATSPSSSGRSSRRSSISEDQSLAIVPYLNRNQKTQPQKPEIQNHSNKSGYQSHYDVLGVQKGSTSATITKAYREKARASHPDKIGGTDEEMKRVNKAHEILSNPRLRRAYNIQQASPLIAPLEKERQLLQEKIHQTFLTQNTKNGALNKDVKQILDYFGTNERDYYDQRGQEAKNAAQHLMNEGYYNTLPEFQKINHHTREIEQLKSEITSNQQEQKYADGQEKFNAATKNLVQEYGFNYVKPSIGLSRYTAPSKSTKNYTPEDTPDID